MGLLSLFFLLIVAVHLGSSAPGRPQVKLNPRSMDRLAIFYDRHKEAGKYRDPATLSLTVENITFTFLKTRNTGFCKMYLEHEAFDRQYIRENGGQRPYLFYDCETSPLGRFLEEHGGSVLLGIILAPVVALCFICCLCSYQRWCRTKHHSRRPSFESSPAPSPPPPPTIITATATTNEIVYADIIPQSSLSSQIEPRIHNSNSSSSQISLGSQHNSNSSHVHWADDEVQFRRPPVTKNASTEESACQPKKTVVLDFVEVPARKSPTKLLSVIFRNMKTDDEEDFL